VTLVDVAAHELTTLLGDEIETVPARLEAYDVIAAVNVRPLLRALRFDPQGRRLRELGPPQKTIRLNRDGRTVTITTELLIRSSCGFARPFSDPARLRRYLSEGRTTRLRRRLEADAKAWHAYEQYASLHGSVRLRWGFLETMIRVPWHDWDLPTFRTMTREALDREGELEVVSGTAPGWEEPWARAHRCDVVEDGRALRLIDRNGFELDPWDVQLARHVEDRIATPGQRGAWPPGVE
jgi:hypothetical protein